MKPKGLVMFLKSRTKKSDLRIALRVIREFKANENLIEWVVVPFEQWKKLEQLEGYLERMTK